MSESALYEGWVRHRRFEPVQHEFRRRLFMAYLDLDELPDVLDPIPLWSARRPAPARFRRGDYLELEHDGPVRLLTHVRTFGHHFNPVSFYYCFDRSGEHVVRVERMSVEDADGSVLAGHVGVRRQELVGVEVTREREVRA